MSLTTIVAIVVVVLVLVAILFGQARSKVDVTAFEEIQSTDSERRLAAVNDLAALAFRHHHNAFEMLDRATCDPNPLVRKTALQRVQEIGQSLGRLPMTPIPDQGRLDHLKAMLLEDDRTRREDAVRQLHQLGDPWLYQAVVQIRRDARDAGADQRRRTARALGELGDPMAYSHLQLALGDEDPGVSSEAESAIQRIRLRQAAQGRPAS